MPNDTTGRARSPVFVVGSARSGTTLLYHILLSSGSFANYRGEPAVFDLIVPKFGDPARRRNRKRLMDVWLQSAMYRLSGLDGNSIRDKVLTQCDSAGGFLQLVMGEIAKLQGKERWAVWGPDNLLYMQQIKKEIPDALFIHMIRDGRDVALSMSKELWIRPFPWDRTQNLVTAALHWEWKVTTGIQSGQSLLPDYLEVNFEELIMRSRDAIMKISRFIGQELDYDQILDRSVGTISSPNTSFQEECQTGMFQPIGRWRRELSDAQVKTLESAIGPLLKELGYELTVPETDALTIRHRMMRQLYPRYFGIKQWLKVNTVLGSLVSLDRMQLSR
jgi:hypothetical protein